MRKGLHHKLDRAIFHPGIFYDDNVGDDNADDDDFFFLLLMFAQFFGQTLVS